MLSQGGSSLPSTSQSRWATNSSAPTSPSHSDRYIAPGQLQHLIASRTAPNGAYDKAELTGLLDPALRQIDEVANSMDLDLEVSGHSIIPRVDKHSGQSSHP